MDATEIANEIQRLRGRLDKMDELRGSLAEDAFAERAELLDEEHRIQARLGELRELASKAGAGMAERKAAAQTDLTRTPGMPPS